MKKEFVTYEQALALKELGYKEYTFVYYDDLKVLTKQTSWKGYVNSSLLSDVSAPIKQQVFRWFREKYDLYHNIWNYTHGEPTDLVPNGFTYSIDESWITIIGKKEDGYFEKYYNNYEEAEQACLDKLIEIVKQKK